MTTWELSDGTVVRADGHVSGTSPLAAELRRDVLSTKAGSRVDVQWTTPPGGTLPLRFGDDPVVDAWVRAEALRFDVTVTSGPEITEEPEEPESDGDEDTIY